MGSNAAIDIGNSQIKIGIFQNGTLIEKISLSDEKEIQKRLKTKTIDRIIVSTVREYPTLLLKDLQKYQPIFFDLQVLHPIDILYTSKSTLGLDRIAGLVGATDVFPRQNNLVIDLGTCITIDFVNDKNEYSGGSISPGKKMRFEALHHFTHSLPMLDTGNDDVEYPVQGNSTQLSIQSGVINGILFELDQFIEYYKNVYPALNIILCGGDAHFFERKLKHAIFVENNLVLKGLNRILEYNSVEKNK